MKESNDLVKKCKQKYFIYIINEKKAKAILLLNEF